MPRPRKEAPNRADGRYVIKRVIGTDSSGRSVYKYFYSTLNKQDCMRQYEEYKIKEKLSLFDELGNNIKFCTYCNKWLKTIKGTVKDSTFALTYENCARHLKDYFNERPMSGIKQLEIQEYFNEKSKILSHESLKKHKSVLAQIYKSAIRNELVSKSPCVDIKIPDNKPKNEKRIYAQEDVDLIIEYAKWHRFGLEVILMLELGLSRSEMLGLKWSDYDSESMTLEIKRGVADVKSAKTGKMEVIVDDPKNIFRKRIIPIKEYICEMLNEKTKTDEFIFTNKSGKTNSPNQWNRRHYKVFMKEMKEYYSSRGIEISMLTAHELRHTRASLWVNNDKNLLAIANVLGHSDLKMLRKRYAHQNVKEIRKLLDI
ncbi:MAG: site-specific integrase [Eubacterium sp.]|jgi:integrase|nr:site-specific integrase [Eubacterium sp.]